MKKLCKILRVSVSGYYAWKSRLPSERDEANELLKAQIIDIHRRSRGNYGSPKITEELRNQGTSCSRKRVARLMRENKIRSRTKRKFRVTTDSKHNLPVAPNLLNRDFSPPKENTVWASDITYVWTNAGWMFLCVILDLFSRRVVGWSMKDNMRQEIVHDALQMAVNRRNPTRGLIFHSDRGSQYAAYKTQEILTALAFSQSMSRKGDCYDNAVSESFFRTLKTELIYHEQFETREAARQAIFEYIEVFYNRQRIHSSLGYLSPERYEELAKVS